MSCPYSNRQGYVGHTFERNRRVQEFGIAVCIRGHTQRHQTDGATRKRAITIRASGGLVTLAQVFAIACFCSPDFCLLHLRPKGSSV